MWTAYLHQEKKPVERIFLFALPYMSNVLILASNPGINEEIIQTIFIVSIF